VYYLAVIDVCLCFSSVPYSACLSERHELAHDLCLYPRGQLYLRPWLVLRAHLLICSSPLFVDLAIAIAICDFDPDLVHDP